MDYEELRPYVLEALREIPDKQILNIVSMVDQRLLSKGFYKESTEWLHGTVGRHKMPEEDMEKIREIIGELLLEGVLMWGLNIANPEPPFLKVTKYGEEVLKAGEPTPHDPDGYLAYMKKEIEGVDETILTYVAEALQAYLKGLMLSSTVMLGAASEKAFLLLLDAYINAISELRQREDFQKKTQGPIKRKFDAFRDEVPKFRSSLPRSISDDLDIQLDGIFNLVRNCRNDVGHPTGRKIDRRLAFANLQLFIPFCKRAYNLIRFFQQNSA